MSAYLDIDSISKAQKIDDYLKNTMSKKTLDNSSFYNFSSGRLAVIQGNYQEGIKKLEKQTSIGDDLIYSRETKIGYKTLFEAYSANNERTKALEAYFIYRSVGDSLKSSQAIKEVSKTQSDYLLEVKEETISDLKKRRVLQQLHVDKQSVKLQLRQFYIIGLILFLILGLIITYLIIRRLKQQKENEKAELKAIQVQLELENLQAKQQAEIFEIKNTLFANVSHEFRTPLTLIQVPIKNYLNKIPASDLPMFNSILKHTDDLMKMIDSLLDAGKLEAGLISINETDFKLSRFFLGIKTIFTPLFKEKNIQLEWNYNLPPSVIKGDEKRLQIVFNNLLKNANHHTPENGRISVTINLINESITNGITISIENTGNPINEKDLPYIFDRYYRADDQAYTGNGIGLSLSREIIALHKGKIEVSKNEENCVAFTVVLNKGIRLAPAENIIIDETITLIPQSNSENVSIQQNNPKNQLPSLLLVEDNSEMMNLLIDVLNEEFELILAKDGAEGITTAIDKKPDLILSDVMMPIKDGFELLNALKTNIETSHIPIVLLTAKSDNRSRIEGLNQDADDYIEKPFDPALLRVRIHNILRGRKAMQEIFKKNPFLLSEKVKCTDLDAVFLEKAISILEENYGNGNFTTNEFCEKLSLNRNSVNNKIKAFTGQSTALYIRNFRLEKAIKMLLETSESITAVYIDNGFNSPQAFIKAFKERFEMTPNEYRKKHQN